jgi:hypothetical protein
MTFFTNVRFSLILLFTLLFACKNEVQPETTATTIDTITVKSLGEYKVDLKLFPESFLQEDDLQKWTELIDLQKSMVSLKDLNPKGITVDLLALNTRIKKMEESPFPAPFDTPQIKSRLRLVGMQANKTRYFTNYYTDDSLGPAYQNLYRFYNAFVDRILSLKEEENTLKEEAEDQ